MVGVLHLVVSELWFSQFLD
ncbi:hypothetical protein F383_29511 [Gossypium arboreum]|uniref:Uncharacterized protein n=1 Tax=Gossypium arboreum TaxID=29729 RepID=A0A0B0PHR0_GOSAR|nr:hypothetical protein F383_29511 [Gossypium arboreum]